MVYVAKTHLKNYLDKKMRKDLKNNKYGVTHGLSKTNNIFYTYKNKTQTSKQWCEEYNISQTTFKDRLNRGWTLEQALTISTKGNHRKVKRDY